LPKITCPVYIFHGTEDEVIYYGSSQKLKEHFKAQDRLITIEGGGHNNLATFSQYATQLKEILQSDKSPK
jgi:pimeloyl-ACP methyl ester carboxylesterase